MRSVDFSCLHDADDDRFEAALALAVRSGVQGEKALFRALSFPYEGRGTRIIAALGEATGDAGVAILRSIVPDVNVAEDPRCAGMIALAKREETAASDVFQSALKDENPTVRRYAVHCLAGVGDDRAWDDVYGYLGDLLHAPAPRFPFAMTTRALSGQSVNLPAVVYLGRHLVSSGREAAIVDMIHSNWHRFYTAEKEWFEVYWPAAVPTYHGTNTRIRPDPESMAVWVRDPLLLPMYSDHEKAQD